MWPEISAIDNELRLIIIGNKPPQQLLAYSSNRIIITGFVEDISPYFKHSLCLVAPLILGAGIKIKIIEAMSAGIPVLTNAIGIEGIDAVDKRHFFYCDSKKDYIENIHLLEMMDPEKKREMSLAEKNYIQEKFNYVKSLEEFVDILDEMVN